MYRLREKCRNYRDNYEKVNGKIPAVIHLTYREIRKIKRYAYHNYLRNDPLLMQHEKPSIIWGMIIIGEGSAHGQKI